MRGQADARRLGLGAALLVGLIGAAGPARAYVRTKTDRGAAVHWRQNCVYITAHAAGAPPNLPPELVASAARAAAAAWSTPQVDCTSLQLQVAVSEVVDAPVANDKHSNLVFRAGEWCREPHDNEEPCYDHSALAITTVFAQQNDGLVLDADTEINAVDFGWGDLEAGIGLGGTNVQDLQNTLTHEFGHLLGLDHNCYSPSSDRSRGIDQNGRAVPDCLRAPASVQAATMYASVMHGDLERRSLAPDDIEGVCDIYPTTTGVACVAAMDGDPTAQPATEDGGGCAVGRGPARTGAGLLVIALGALALRRRRLNASPRG
jgi:MYXO-CTERM domain-containing protein